MNFNSRMGRRLLKKKHKSAKPVVCGVVVDEHERTTGINRIFKPAQQAWQAYSQARIGHTGLPFLRFSSFWLYYFGTFH